MTEEFVPREGGKHELTAMRLVGDHLKHILSEAVEHRIPIESIAQALCFSAGVGLARLYMDDPKAGDAALEKCSANLRGAFRISVGKVTLPDRD